MIPIEYLSEALYNLRMERPRTRLLAVYIAAYSKPENESDELSIDRIFSLAGACEWLGWHTNDVVDAAIDLAEQEIIKLRPIKTDRIEFFYYSDERIWTHEEMMPSVRPPAYKMRSVYVITADGQTSKIGIAYKPEQRLSNLQTGSPLQKLSISFAREVPAAIARRVELRAHQMLAAHSIGREWFRVSAETAIEAVTKVIAEELTEG